MGQTFRAICPGAGVLHVFELVSEKGRMTGWCTKCRQTWPLDGLSDGKTDEKEVRPARARGSKNEHKKGKTGK